MLLILMKSAIHMKLIVLFHLKLKQTKPLNKSIHYTKNIMKKLLFILGLFLSFIEITAQNAELTYGSEGTQSDKTSVFEMIGETNDGIFTLRKKMKLGIGAVLFLEKYDKNNLVLLETNEIKFPFNGYFLKFVIKEGVIYAFVKRFESKSNKRSLYLTTLSPKGVLDNKMIELATSNSDNGRWNDDFEISLSTDSSKILVAVVPEPNKKAIQTTELVTVNFDGKEKVKTEFEFDYNDRDFEFKDYLLDNSGNVHLLAKVKLEESTKGKSDKDYEYKIYTHYKNTKKLHEYTIQIPNHYVSNVLFKLNNKGKLYCAGFYSSPEDKLIKGTFNFVINTESKKIENFKTFEFEADFIEDFTKVKYSFHDKGLKHFVVKDIIFKNDGGILFLSEYNFEYYDSDLGMIYSFGEFIVIDYAEMGDVNWCKRVPKIQNSNQKNTSSCFYYYNNDILYLIFNDHSGDNSGERTTILAGIKNTTIVTVSKDGKFKRSLLFTKKTNKFWPLTSVHYITGNEIVACAISSSKCKLIKIKLI